MASDTASDLAQARAQLEAKCLYDLSKKTLQLLPQIVGTDQKSVEGWSFVPHPALLQRLPGFSLKRYIVIIDTMSSDLYFPVLNFLKAEKANITSYYSGGWADFLCDIQLGEKQFEVWIDRLRRVLVDANSSRYSKKTDDFITVFEVTEEKIVCGVNLADFPNPTNEIIEEIRRDIARFELTFRNYNSKEAINQFGDEKSLRKYLRRLKTERAILCFRAVADSARYRERDYVALRAHGRVVNSLLDTAQNDQKRFLDPVQDLVKIKWRQVVDRSEEDITHIFINQYEFPGQRHDWKAVLYEWANPGSGGESGTIDINMYNYPLEGTVNASSIFISDLPEFLDRSDLYRRASSRPNIEIGTAFHQAVPDSDTKVGVPFDGLQFHGVTLGLPGSGKTNTGLVIATSSAKILERFVILDGTKGVWNKISGLEAGGKINATRLICETDNLIETVTKALASSGIVVLEFPADKLGEVVDAALDILDSQEDATAANKQRVIKSGLMIEEASDAWVSDPGGVRFKKLMRFLDKSFRRGWFIWLSTQRPGKLGPTEADSRDLLTVLKNRVIHSVDSELGEAALLDVLRGEGHSAEDIDYVKRGLHDLPKGVALVRAAGAKDGKPTYLPPLFTKVPVLQSLIEKGA